MRLVRCMSEKGHSRPGRAGGKSGHVRCTAENGSNPPSPPRSDTVRLGLAYTGQ
jgi:hypothetical protein